MTQVASSDSLLWIKNELDGTLVRARQALETYVEQPDSTEALQQCREYLHQVQGTLRIVEVYGAAMLTEEMEAVTNGLSSGDIARSDAAFEVLMRAMLLLPDYLERVVGGRRDVPLALLSLLNELREVRGQPLLSESALFAHNLVGRPTTPLEHAAAKDADIVSVAKVQRPKFQMSLLGWYKGDQPDQHLSTLADICEQLEQASTTPPVFELWWIVGGVLEALRDHGLEPDVPLKQMLGQVDRQIKRLIDDGETAVAEAAPQELVNNLLYYIGRASSDGRRVAGIKEAFKLVDILPETTEIEAARESMAAPNIKLMRTVSGAIKDDLARVKDTLDIFVRMGSQNLDELVPLVELLKKVGDTLSVLGLGKLRTELEPQRVHLHNIAIGNEPPEEQALMEIASGIINLESRVEDQVVRLANAGESQAPASELDEDREAEYQQVFRAVIRESIINLARVKEAIVEFVNDATRTGIVTPLPGHLYQIQAGLRLLEMEKPAALLDCVRYYINERIIHGEHLPAQNELDRMADAIVSVEFYLEAMEQGRGNPESMLDNAEACVQALGFPIGYVPPEQSPEDTGIDVSEEAEIEEVMLSEEDDFTGESTIQELAATTPSEELELATEGAEANTDVVKTPPAPPSVEEKIAVPVVAIPDEVDPEIVEIFLEEAQEEMASLREQFPRWRDNPQDTDALTTVRRSFHTLKGSGRMVGAQLIGEFAWSIENMLNRVIDKTIQPSEAMFDLVEAAIAALPELVEQLEAGSQPKADITGLMETAVALSSGAQAVEEEEQTAADIASGSDEEESAQLAGMAVETDERTSGMNPVLHDIFSREVDQHLDVVRAFLNRCGKSEDGTCKVNEDLMRALHTLHGSASIAGVSEVADLVLPAEQLVTYLWQHKATFPVEAVDMFAEMSEQLRLMVAEALESLPPEQDVTDLYNRLQSLNENIVTELPSAEAAIPVDDQPVREDGDAQDADDLLESGLDQLESAINASVDEGVVDEQPVEQEEVSENIPSEAAASESHESETVAEPATQEREDRHVINLADLPDYDSELASIFFDEATELLEVADNTLHAWSNDKSNSSLVLELQRHLHTLKGGARMAGVTPMGNLSHEMETLLTAIVDGKVSASTEGFALLNRTLDRLHRMLEQGYAQQPIIDADDLVSELLGYHGQKSSEEEEDEFAGGIPPAELPDGRKPGVAEPGKTLSISAEAVLGGETDRRGSSRIQQELVRVRSDLLENVLNYAGEVGIYRSRLEQQVNSINFNLAELDQTVVRLRDQLRKLEIETETQILYQWQQEGGERENLEFDPLELDRFSLLQQLSRALAESVGDLVSIQSLLSNQAREAETLLLQQSRVTTELQDGVMRTRMVPFSRHAQRMRRIVRQTADEVGKKVDIRLIGAEGEMDRQVMERILAPLEHMLRNSVIHGIEQPAERSKAGKLETGEITVGIHREGSEVVIEVLDDGAGLNLSAIRAKAESLGLTRPDAMLTESDIMQFILESGFSTAEEITQSAGRGVGMDVVANEIKQLGGSLAIDSSRGEGAKFTIRLPFTLAITQSLLVNVSDQLYAIPLPSIEGIARIPRRELDRYLNGEGNYLYGNREYTLQHLSVLLGFGVPALPEDIASVPVLLVRAGDHFSAVITEGMQGSREIVVKSVGPQVSSIKGISGATVLGDGSILLILDVGGLVRAAAQKPISREEIPEREAPSEDTRTMVMVVDDSITVRRVTQRLLERYEMRVLTAKDGVDALALLQENVPDVMLLDIEMPRMDGYELAQHMRNDDRFKDIPIIMITSRTGDKHRNRAMEIGVNRYLGKPYQEQELLENIQELTGKFNPRATRWGE